MNKQLQTVQQNTSPFDAIKRIDAQGLEYWSARDLQAPLGYEKWDRFEDCIERAMIACQNSGHEPSEQFADAGNLLKRGKYATQEQKDYHLTRFACYLTAMNGDPRKAEIAAAQTYFAIKTREAETNQVQQTPLATGLDGFIKQLYKEIYQKQGVLEHLEQAQSLLTGEVPNDFDKMRFKITSSKSVHSEILRIVHKFQDEEKPAPTMREFAKYLKNIDPEKLKATIAGMVEAGTLHQTKTGKATRYSLLDGTE